MELKSFNAYQTYYFTIETFNEKEVSESARLQKIEVR